jgi:hypothetical protein
LNQRQDNGLSKTKKEGFMDQSTAFFPEVARDFLTGGTPDILRSSLTLWMKTQQEDDLREIKEFSLKHLNLLKQSAAISKRSDCVQIIERVIKELENDRPDHKLVCRSLTALEHILKCAVARSDMRPAEKWPDPEEKRREWLDHQKQEMEEF